MKKSNPNKNTYYWRAVKRLAEKRGVTIAKARKMDWEKEANAERKRRSKAHVHPPSKPVTRGKPVKRKTVPLPARESRKPSKPYRRKHTPAVRRTKVPPRRVVPELKLKDYERIRRGGTSFEEYEEELDDEETGFNDWQDDWEEDFPELDALDDLEDFLESIEYEESDKYKEPS